MMNTLSIFFYACFGNARKRYESRHRIISAIASRMGYRLYNKNLMWLNDDEYIGVWSQFPLGATSIHERKYNMYYIAKALSNVDGDLAECGVFHGGTSFLMLSANANNQKHLYGFDSFEGLSEPQKKDKIRQKRTFSWKKNDMSYSEHDAVENLRQYSNRATFFKGWIPDRFDEVGEKSFSLVHIDVDLYDPTMQSIEFFYPRLSKGGFIVCDDYGSEACPGAFDAMNMFAQSVGTSVISLTTGQGIIIKH